MTDTHHMTHTHTNTENTHKLIFDAIEININEMNK